MNPLLVLVWATCGALAVFTAGRVVARAWRARQEIRQLEGLHALVDSWAREVGAGARPVDGLAHAVEHTPPGELRDELGSVARMVQLGAAPGASRDGGSAGHLGRSLDFLLGLWELNRAHGVALGALLSAYAVDIEAHLAHRARSSSAMAGARMTVIVLLGLPLAALGLGESMGLGAMRILLCSPVGAVLLLVGVSLACAGVGWTEVLSARALALQPRTEKLRSVSRLGGVGGRAGPRSIGDLDAARSLDIFAEALASGATVTRSWQIASAGAGDAARQVAALLAVGAGASAWRHLVDDPAFGPIARQAVQQTRAGFALAEGARNHAVRLRRRAADASRAASERILVALAAPLTLCFLPAFVALGLLPLVMGLAGM